MTVPMTRAAKHSEQEARDEVPIADRTFPPWPVRQHSLPFDILSDDEFEIFCFLLLKAEYPGHAITYFGKTADGGRDIVHEWPDGARELIQCKRYEDNVGIGAV